MGESNGSAKATNGHAKSHTNGYANGHTNGKAVQPVNRRQVPVKKRRGFVAWCPQSLEQCDETSPYICKYYVQTRDAISPRVQPYYDQYAAPYVDVVAPYYETVNTKVITPARSYAMHYGAPYAEKAQVFGKAQWEKNGQPQLQQIQQLTRTKYDQTVAPYLNQASDAFGPYYEIGRTNGLQMYHDYLLPGYAVVQPYAAKGYDAASDFTTTTALPSAYWAWNKSYAFVDTTIWPQLRVLYVENVEPQLVRIGERLGRYKTKMAKSSPIKSPRGRTTEATYSSFSKAISMKTSSTASESIKSTASVVASVDDNSEDDVIKPVEAPPAGENESEVRKTAREMVAEDLETWQNKFVSQADEGADAIEDRIAEITKRMMQKDAQTTGKGLVDKLDQVIKSELNTLKKKISATVAGIDGNADNALETSVTAVRSAGVAIKDAASAVRKWRQDYNVQLESEVVKAADIHFKILDETRNLALQQIGMKWAWTDGVTYKDWAKYHELKDTLSGWTQQLKDMIVTDPNLIEAQEASASVEDESMEFASVAAKELARLKEVAQWKITARDASDDFESETMRLAAEAAESGRRRASEGAEYARKKAAEAAEAVSREASQKSAEADATIVEPVKEAVNSAAGYAEDASTSASGIVSAAKDTVVEQATAASQSVKDAAGKASDAVEDQSTAASQSASSVLSEGQEATNAAAEELSSTVANDFYSTVSDSASSIVSEASSLVSEAVSSVTGGSDDEVAQSYRAAKASEVLAGEEVVDDVLVQDAVIEEDPSTQKDDTPIVDTTASVKPVFLGAAAAEILEERNPILEDYVDTDIISNVGAAAESAYSNALAAASAQYSSAVSVVSAQIYGTPAPVHEQLFSSVSGAYEGALAAASSRYNDAVSAAATGISKASATVVPSPTTALVDWNKVESIAAQRLNEGRLWAEIQYQSALIALGVSTATPTSAPDRVLQEAKKNYYAGLGLAQERYGNFMAAASSAMHSLTASATPTDVYGTASSIASVAQESAASVVNAAQESAASVRNAAEEAAGSAYSAATDTVASAIEYVDEGILGVAGAASEQMYVAGAALAETWDNVVSELNLQIYGAEHSQIGWYDNLFKDATSAANAATDKAAAFTTAAGESAVTASAEAAKQYNAVTDLVAELLLGKEAPFTESVLSRLNAAYATAASNVESFASDASSAASSVGDKVGSAASQATDAVKESVKHVRDEL